MFVCVYVYIMRNDKNVNNVECDVLISNLCATAGRIGSRRRSQTRSRQSSPRPPRQSASPHASRPQTLHQKNIRRMEDCL